MGIRLRTHFDRNAATVRAVDGDLPRVDRSRTSRNARGSRHSTGNPPRLDANPRGPSTSAPPWAHLRAVGLRPGADGGIRFDPPPLPEVRVVADCAAVDVGPIVVRPSEFARRLVALPAGVDDRFRKQCRLPARVRLVTGEAHVLADRRVADLVAKVPGVTTCTSGHEVGAG